MVNRTLAALALALVVAACDAPGNPIPVDDSTVRFSAVASLGTLDHDGYVGLTPEGDLTRDHTIRVEQRFFDPVLGARIMSDGTRWVDTQTKTEDGVRIFNVVSPEGAFLRSVAVSWPLDARGHLVLARDREYGLFMLDVDAERTRR